MDVPPNGSSQRHKGINLSKFQSSNVLKNLLLFSLHGKQFPSQVFIFLLSKLLFIAASTKEKYKPFQSESLPCSHLVDTSRLHIWQYFENVVINTLKLRK